MSKKNRAVLRPGDILEVPLGDGVAFIQYVGTHAVHGDFVLLLPGVFKSPPPDFTSLISQRCRTAFYMATASVRAGLTKIVANAALPRGCTVPPILRRAGRRSLSGEVETWIIEGDGKDQVRHALSSEEVQLPIAAIWNHEFLLLRIAEFNLPADHRVRRTLIERNKHVGPDAENGTLTHYLYFPDERAARGVATQLRTLGYSVDLRLSADDINWQVMAQGEKLEAKADVHEMMEEIALNAGGEYDGWETKIS